MAEPLAAYVREAFGWDEDVVITAGPRGALGQIWRLEVGPARYALKEIFHEPPSDRRIEAESAFTRRAARAGVRLPASHPDREGRYVLAAPGGTWLRLYDWVDLAAVGVATPMAARDLGMLLARLHRCAPVSAAEFDGDPPARWYDQVPLLREWERVTASDTVWAPRLAERLSTIARLCAMVTPVDADDLVICHRDLHPDNVLADPAEELVVVDWDNAGPAAPGRELAQMLFDWFCDGPEADLDAMRLLYESYLDSGGPGRVTGPADFSMLLATRINFFLLQTRIAIDPRTDPRTRERAEHEIDEALRILPTPQQLTDALNMAYQLIPGRSPRAALPHTSVDR